MYYHFIPNHNFSLAHKVTYILYQVWFCLYRTIITVDCKMNNICCGVLYIDWNFAMTGSFIISFNTSWWKSAYFINHMIVLLYVPNFPANKMETLICWWYTLSKCNQRNCCDKYCNLFLSHCHILSRFQEEMKFLDCQVFVNPYDEVDEMVSASCFPSSPG